MKYIFLGLLIDFENEFKLLERNKNNTLQPQSCQYQWGVINGINDCKNIHIDVISSIPMGGYPLKSSFFFVKRDLIDSKYGVRYIGFINSYFLREYCRYFGFLRYLQKYINNYDEEITIIVYSMYYPFMKIIKWIKSKYNKRVKIVLIVPDLPGKYGVKYNNPIKNFVIYYHSDKQYKYAKIADSYILLTEEMKNPLKIQDKPYVVIEGFLPQVGIQTSPVVKSPKKIILYTGSLNPAFGINELLEQFTKITLQDYELWICGQEFYNGQIKKFTEKDPRIKYFGFLNKDKVHSLQRQATLLINPRRPEGEFTKYSFPSKTMEYMLSGTPVLMYKLAGIPKEYYPYLNFIDESEPDGIKNAIMAICEKDKEYLNNIGKKARDFILTKDNCHQIELAINAGII